MALLPGLRPIEWDNIGGPLLIRKSPAAEWPQPRRRAGASEWRMVSFGQRTLKIDRLQRRPKWLVSECAAVNLRHLIGFVDLGECVIDGETEILIAAPQCQAIGLDTHDYVGLFDHVGRRRLHQFNEDRPIG